VSVLRASSNVLPFLERSFCTLLGSVPSGALRHRRRRCRRPSRARRALRVPSHTHKSRALSGNDTRVAAYLASAKRFSLNTPQHKQTSSRHTRAPKANALPLPPHHHQPKTSTERRGLGVDVQPGGTLTVSGCVPTKIGRFGALSSSPGVVARSRKDEGREGRGLSPFVSRLLSSPAVNARAASARQAAARCPAARHRRVLGPRRGPASARLLSLSSSSSLTPPSPFSLSLRATKHHQQGPMFGGNVPQYPQQGGGFPALGAS
jgi:hypothetical protein